MITDAVSPASFAFVRLTHPKCSLVDDAPRDYAITLGQSPRRAAHLKPENYDALGAIDQQVLDELDPRSFDEAERASTRDAADRLSRLEADRDHVDELRETNFAGWKYEIFTADLAAYGIPVIRSWLRTRQIYKLSRARGRGVSCDDDVREHLATHADDRLELTIEIVAHGLAFFRSYALVNGAWTPEAGASLKTFFIGSCLAVFPNTFRAWLKEHNAGAFPRGYAAHPATDASELDRLILPSHGDPADAVADQLWFVAELESMPERVRHAIAAVVLRDEDYTTIAARLGMTTNAVKQMLYRYRAEARRRQKERRQP